MADGLFHEESVCYAIKLARRINCSISVLMLQTTAENGNRGSNNAQNVFTKIIDRISVENIPVRGRIRSGDKASEFLKHLVEYPSFQTIVWGGEEDPLAGRKSNKTDDWFAKIKSTIRCPVVRPTVKDNAEIKHK